MYNLHSHSSEYLEIDRSIFLKKSYSARLKPHYKGKDSYFAYKNSRISTMQALIGEYIERDSLYYNNNTKILNAFCLTTGETIELPISDVLLNLNLPVMEDKIPTYLDTCGVATHTISSKALDNALSEFIERQSLITTWLTKSESIEVDIKLIEKYIDPTNVLIKNYDFFIRDISLWDFFYVILFVGYDFEKEKFIIGCSANSSFEKALMGAYDEAILMEHYYQQDGLREDGRLIEFKYEGTILKDAYAQNFYKKTVQEFYEDVFFLKEKCTKPSKDYLVNKFDLKDLKKTGLKIYGTLVPCQNNKNFKTVKVFSPDGYPHMSTDILEPEKYKISSLYNLEEFPNKGVMLPFP